MKKNYIWVFIVLLLVSIIATATYIIIENNKEKEKMLEIRKDFIEFKKSSKFVFENGIKLSEEALNLNLKDKKKFFKGKTINNDYNLVITTDGFLFITNNKYKNHLMYITKDYYCNTMSDDCDFDISKLNIIYNPNEIKIEDKINDKEIKDNYIYIENKSKDKIYYVKEKKIENKEKKPEIKSEIPKKDDLEKEIKIEENKYTNLVKKDLSYKKEHYLNLKTMKENGEKVYYSFNKNNDPKKQNWILETKDYIKKGELDGNYYLNIKVIDQKNEIYYISRKRNFDNSNPIVNLSFNSIKDSIEAEIFDYSKIDKAKVFEGDKDIEFFKNNYAYDLIDNNAYINKNSLYTIYIKDSLGFETIEKININNIEKYTSEELFDFTTSGKYSSITNFKEKNGIHEQINIPKNLGYKQLLSINENAFKANSGETYKIKKLKTNGVLEFIGSKSFYNLGIEELLLNDSIKIISEDAFYSNMISILELPKELNYIGDDAFEDNNLTSLIVNEKLKIIGSGAFGSNESIGYLNLGGDIEYIGRGSFANSGITEVVFGSKNKYIGEEAFEGNLITSLTLNEGLKNIEEYAFADNKIADLYIPSSVINIGESAFEGNLITNLTLNEGLRTIGEEAFVENRIVNLILPSTVTYVGEGSFAANPISNLELKDGITGIMPEAFEETKLGRLIIPPSLKNIGPGAFEQAGITELIISEGVESIGEYAFEDNEFLTSVTLPSTLKSIGYNAFYDSYISYIKLPKGLQFISNDVFEDEILIENCSSLNLQVEDVVIRNYYSVVLNRPETCND